jgi:glycosyltransferase involved in cell wall biosynthesis
MRVCIVADSASVRFGGEAILPYHYFRLLSKQGVDTWLIVHERTREELESSLPEYRHRILFTPDVWLQKRISSLSRFLPRRIAGSTLGLLGLVLVQSQQRRVIRALIRREGIDVVHQPTPVSPRLPSLMYGLGIPVVIGPLNGGMDYPVAFRGHESALSHFAIAAARSMSDTVNSLLPGKLRATTLLVANPRTHEALPARVRGRVVELVENAVDLEIWQPKPERLHIQPVPTQFVFLGRLVSWKRLDIALHALTRLPQASLVVIGGGAQELRWQQLTRDLKIEERVQFLGWLPQEECAPYLAQSAALVLPSVYECGGAVVLEAMASARPVIATRWGGPSDYLDESCGVLVSPDSYETMVQRFADAMELISNHPEIGARMGAAGLLRVQQRFSWPQKIEAIQEIYRQALERAHVQDVANSGLRDTFAD